VPDAWKRDACGLDGDETETNAEDEIMRKVSILAGCVLLFIAVGDAGAFWVGAEGGSANGGNLNENSTAFGVQVGGKIDDTFSVEMSGTKFSDSEPAMKMDITSLAVTGLAGVNVMDNVRLYAGAGLDFNMIYARVDVLEMLAHQEGKSVEDFVRSQHLTMDEARTAVDQGGLAVNVKFNDTIGYHVTAGASVNISDGFQLFAQYRYTWTRESGDLSTDAYGTANTYPDAFSRNYAYGLLMIGFNLIM
jgi:opacity protein-like surface antigen